MTHPRRIAAAVFLMAASVLATEIILTRIFSVLLWYHFAFLAICVCLFGLGVGSLALHLFGRNLKLGDLHRHLAVCAFGYAFSQTACILILRVLKLGSLNMTPSSLAQLAVVFAACSIPFGFAGFFLGLAFSRGSERIARLYFADLAGASAGCVATISLLEWLGGPAALVAVGILAAVAGMAAASRREDRGHFAALVSLAALLSAVIVVHRATGFLDFRHTKGNDEPAPLAVKWNSFSRVIAYARPEVGDIMMVIDGVAHAPITPFRGDAQATQNKMANVQRLPFEFVPDASAVIIGSGGGEHILTALATGAKHVVGVEMNPIVIDMVDRRFASMAGGLFHQPGVEVVKAEGRSYVARSREKFDIVSFTLIDTWAATAAGAFSLTENYLFTKESFNEYFDHLSPRGFLSIKRWREPPEYPLRLAVLARAVLQDRGIEKPENCVFIAGDDDFVNVLIKPSPFKLEDIIRLRELCLKLDLKILYSPNLNTPENLFSLVLTTPEPESVLASMVYDLSPPTDNHPFFFYTLRLKDLAKTFSLAWGSKIRNVGALILYGLVGVVFVFVVLLLLGPLLLMRRHRLLLRGNLRAGAYFALIGVGFLTLENGLMQSFILYLGHPTLTLAVFLATLLLAGGIGAGFTGRVALDRPQRALLIAVIGLVGYALILRGVTPRIFAQTLGWTQNARCALTALLLAPLGFLMGMPFPLGIRAVRNDGIVPWMFAVNSAASVLGSVGAIVLALTFGFTVTAVVGLAAYLAALVVYPAEDA